MRTFHKSRPAARAFECVRTTGTRAGEVYHLNAGNAFISCDCAGKSYAASDKANWRAAVVGEDTYATSGCIHSDAVRLLLSAGLLDVPAEVVAS